jgi:hypothetical protein
MLVLMLTTVSVLERTQLLGIPTGSVGFLYSIMKSGGRGSVQGLGQFSKWHHFFFFKECFQSIFDGVRQMPQTHRSLREGP